MAPEHSLEVPEGPGSAPEVSGMSWKLLEGHGRFREVPPTPLRPLYLGGKAPHRVWPKFGPSPIRTRLSKVGRTPHKEGVLVESFISKGGVPEDSTPYISAKGPPGHIYNEGRGWG